MINKDTEIKDYNFFYSILGFLDSIFLKIPSFKQKRMNKMGMLYYSHVYYKMFMKPRNKKDLKIIKNKCIKIKNLQVFTYYKKCVLNIK